MSRHFRRRILLALGWLLAFGPGGEASGQLAPRPASAATPARPSRAELMRAALASNPITAPYPIQTFERGNRVVLRGVVGTKVIYDAAVRTAIASGIPFDDELVIDTLAAHDVAARGAAAAAAFPPPIAPTYGATGGYPPPTYMPFGPTPGGAPGLIYPPPLFGVIDEPFFGFEPPVISYPPYWGALSSRRLAEAAAFGPGAAPGAVPMAGGPGTGQEPPPGVVDVELDPLGVATIRGVVPSLADRVTIGQQLARTPGISQVINLLRVDPALAGTLGTPPDPPEPGPEARPIAPRPDAGGPEPGPEPKPVPPVVRPPVVPPPPAPGLGGDEPVAGLSGLAGLPVRVTVVDGTATIEGEVKSATDAMAAYLAVKRHPGVVEVVDRMRFPVPIEPGANPLRSADDPRDVEDYLGDQIRRQLVGVARVGRVRLLGDRLEVQGLLNDPDDRRRAEAILRSTPVLRGFALAMRFDRVAP